jgi:hypothetical protein
MVMNLKDINRQAKAESDEQERKRQAKVAQIQRDTNARKKAAAEADDLRRAEEQQRLKIEVKNFYLFTNQWAKEDDFERAWKDDKERVIREHKINVANIQRM